MIRFSCICSQPYEVPDDQAGTSFQCRACDRLVEVPTLSELPTISPDGTYRIDADPEPRTIDQQLTRVSDLERVYTRQHLDRHGHEIDLRTTPQEVADAGVDEVPLELADAVRPAAPKYDPITGELIRPLDVKDDRATSGKGIWLGPPLRYGRESLPFQPWQIIPELFSIPNLAVIVGVLCVHFLMLLMAFPIYLGMWFLLVFYISFAAALLAHYANVVEEIGPTGQDELPRPFRDLQWQEDLCGPLGHFVLALILAYGIAVAAFYLPKSARAPYLLAAGVFGTIVFPALLLTAVCSGSILNLRPDRVLRVIKACGGSYPLLIVGWLIAAVAYPITFAAATLSALHLFDYDHKIFYAWYLNPLITLPAFIAAVFFTHALMWYLGLQYRYHCGEFGWVLQAHERDPNLPRNRGFEVQRPRPGAKPAAPTDAPIAAQPVIPIEPDELEDETPAQAAERRRRILEQTRELHSPQPHGVQHPIRPESPTADTSPPPPPLPPLPPPDDNFDIDELLKP